MPVRGGFPEKRTLQPGLEGWGTMRRMERGWRHLAGVQREQGDKGKNAHLGLGGFGRWFGDLEAALPVSLPVVLRNMKTCCCSQLLQLRGQRMGRWSERPQCPSKSGHPAPAGMQGTGHTPEAPARDSGCCSHLKILPACPGFTLCGSFLHQAQGLTLRLPCLPSSRSCLPWCKTGFALHTRSVLWVEGVWILSRREECVGTCHQNTARLGWLRGRE